MFCIVILKSNNLFNILKPLCCHSQSYLHIPENKMIGSNPYKCQTYYGKIKLWAHRPSYFYNVYISLYLTSIFHISVWIVEKVASLTAGVCFRHLTYNSSKLLPPPRFPQGASVSSYNSKKCRLGQLATLINPWRMWILKVINFC